jgi:hypothetical protein
MSRNKTIECDNCHGVYDDYYYKCAAFTTKTCSLSCMAEYLCKNNICNIKAHLDAMDKIILQDGSRCL